LTASASSHPSGAKFFDWPEMPDRRVIHQDIDRLKAAEQVSHHGFNGSALRQVGGNAYRIDAKAGPEMIPCLFRLDQIMQDSIGSCAGKAFRHGQSKACRRSGHESPFALQHRMELPRLFLLIQLGEYFPRIAESLDAGRHAAIDRDLHEHLAYFLARGTVGQRAPNMSLEFVRAIERAQHREVEKTARLVRNAIAAPDITPAIFRREVLHWTIEVVGRRDSLVDELVAKDAFAIFRPRSYVALSMMISNIFDCGERASSWARTAGPAPVAAGIP
jgi:hypothetical protein